MQSQLRVATCFCYNILLLKPVYYLLWLGLHYLKAFYYSRLKIKTKNKLIVKLKSLGEALGDALGDALGISEGEALGEALGLELGEELG